MSSVRFLLFDEFHYFVRGWYEGDSCSLITIILCVICLMNFKTHEPFCVHALYPSIPLTATLHAIWLAINR